MSTVDFIKIAKRNHNTKRRYLLVNELQGKHIPVDPDVCLDMLNSFAERLKTHFPNVGLIIGFAETATAVGAAVAAAYDDAFYITTTRENVKSDNIICFKEEHSHAVDHMLVNDNLAEIISKTDTIMLIDDELSTGKTIRNIVKALREQIPEIRSKRIVAASIVNRMSQEDLGKFNDENIECDWYRMMPNIDYTNLIDSFNTIDPDELDPSRLHCPIAYTVVDYRDFIPDIRYGKVGKTYFESIRNVSIAALVSSMKNIYGDVLVLGTEECMYPAIVFGSILKEISRADTSTSSGSDFPTIKSVRTHATTRSPICVSADKDYPIKRGFKITSFYGDYDTYLYNTNHSYNTVVIVTDSKRNIDDAIRDVIFTTCCKNVYVLRY